jgi:hypothetical protein
MKRKISLILYLNKIGLQKLQKQARSKCAVFAPLLRAGFRNFFANHFPFGIVILFSVSIIFAQPGRKPSPTRASKNDLKQKSKTIKNSLNQIKTKAEFDLLARVYHQGTPYALPHLMFVIDRKDKNKIYYVNSKKYTFHKDFVNGSYLSLERGDVFFVNNYINANRRFIMGTLAWQTPVKKWTFEFWEGDLIPSDQIKLAYEIINKTFFQSVAFKPNSIRQDEASANLSINRITTAEINKNQEYIALNTARGVGRIHIIDKLDDTVEIGYNEILVLKEVPVSLPPVAGIIISQPSTPLSHVNLLAKGWGVPNAYIKNAHELFKEFDTYWVEFETKLDRYSIKRADKKTLDDWQKEQNLKGLTFKSPRSDLKVTKLAGLKQQRAKDVIAYGAKSANLAEVVFAKLPNIVVPNGFSIPFYYYDKFMDDNGFSDKIADFLYDQTFIHNPKERRRMLSEFRAEIVEKGKFDEKLKAEIIELWQKELGGKGVFVRSSSNSEDLPNFSGAGLYTTVPNVKEADKLIEAVKTVWASLWNFEAFEARERNFIDHTGVYMGVLIQEGVNSESSGVLITKDPYNPDDKGAIYISAKRGLGIKVVEGKRIAEQILFSPKSNTPQILTRSDEDTLLTFDENGGVKEIPIDGTRNVLTDKLIRQLVKTGAQIKRLFGGKRDQDIEWGYANGQVFIFQARPVVEK